MSRPHFIVDRIEGGYAVVWSAHTEDTLDIPVAALPEDLCEGDGLALTGQDGGPVKVMATVAGQSVLAVESVLRLTCGQGGLPPGTQTGDFLVFVRLPANAETMAMIAQIRRLAAADDGGDWSI